MTWDEIKDIALKKAELLDNDYLKRLKIEIKEIEKQGANAIWVEYVNTDKKWDNNKNGLVLPFLLEMTPIDPIKVEMTYILDDNGVPGDIIDIIVDGELITIPGDVLVETKRGIVRASLLQVGDEVE